MTPEAMLHKLTASEYWREFIMDDEREVITAGLQALSYRYGVYANHTDPDDDFGSYGPTIHQRMFSDSDRDRAIAAAEAWIEAQENWENLHLYVVDHHENNKVCWNSDRWKIDHSPAPVFFSMNDVMVGIGLTRDEKFWLSKLTWDDVRPVINQPDGVRLFKAYLTEYIGVRDQPVVKL